MIPLHLGPLHPVEQALTYGLAFGPFLLLALVVVVRRRQDARDEAASDVPAADDAGSLPSDQPRAR